MRNAHTYLTIKHTGYAIWITISQIAKKTLPEKWTVFPATCVKIGRSVISGGHLKPMGCVR